MILQIEKPPHFLEYPSPPLVRPHHSFVSVSLDAGAVPGEYALLPSCLLHAEGGNPFQHVIQVLFSYLLVGPVYRRVIRIRFMPWQVQRMDFLSSSLCPPLSTRRFILPDKRNYISYQFIPFTRVGEMVYSPVSFSSPVCAQTSSEPTP